MKNLSRRNFIKNAGLSASMVGAGGLSNTAFQRQKLTASKLPREVWIASLTQHQITGRNCEEVIQAALKQMKNALPYAPDIICLPEVFHVTGVKAGRPPLKESAEDGSGKFTGPFQKFAQDNHCNIICPIYSTDNNQVYNTAFVINRKGEITGQYRKIRPTITEMEKGITPGPDSPPVFKTDFGIIGIQICYDIEWTDAWEQLKNKGAEIVFWPSAFAGGKKVNTRAWTNQYCVVSSTRKDTTKITDITGAELAVSGNWSRWGICAPVNLEKAVLHSYPYSYRFPDIRQKYGRKVNCYSLHEEEFSVIESLSPGLRVKDILKEFDLITYRESLQQAAEHQRKMR